MAENEVWEAQDVTEEDGEHFDPLLDNVDMATTMEDDVDSESGSQNGLRGVGVAMSIPPVRKKELWRHGRDQGPQGKRTVADG